MTRSDLSKVAGPKQSPDLGLHTCAFASNDDKEINDVISMRRIASIINIRLLNTGYKMKRNYYIDCMRIKGEISSKLVTKNTI